MADDVIPPRLTPRQQKIFEALADLDKSLADGYLGAHIVLTDAQNPDRIAQSAHSIREITATLSNKGRDALTEEEKAVAGQNESTNARQLENVFDPLGGVRVFRGQSVYDKWNSHYHKFFIDVSHHRFRRASESIGEEITPISFERILNEYEDFLIKFILPTQTEIFKIFDQLIATGPSDKIDVVALKYLISRNLESHKYFFAKIDSSWLDFLLEQKIIDPKQIDNVVSEYLGKTAKEKPAETLKVFKAANLTKDHNSFILRNAVRGAINMPAGMGKEITQMLKKGGWLAKKDVLISYTLRELLEKMVEQKEYQSALELTLEILQPDPNGKSGSLRGDWFVSAHEYKEILTTLATIPDNELQPFVIELIKILEGANRIHRDEDGESEDTEVISDASHIWREAIEGHDRELGGEDHRSLLIESIRDLSERILLICPDNKVSEKLNDLFAGKKPYEVLVRIKLHLLRKFKSAAKAEAAKAVIKYFDAYGVWHEYSFLLREVLSDLPIETRAEIFTLIDKGPEKEPDEDYKKHWQGRILIMLRDSLTPEEKTKYSEQLAIGEKIEKPDLMSYVSGGTWVGPKTPVKKEDLLLKPLPEILEILTKWQLPADKEIFGPSYEGLGRTFGEVVAKRHIEFAKSAQLFAPSSKLRPVYIYHLFSGLNQPLRNRITEGFDWNEIFSLAEKIVDAASSKTLPEFDLTDDGYEPNWEAVFKSMADFMDSALDQRENPIDFNLREKVLKIISFLTKDPNPTPEHEIKYGGDNSDPYTMSVNTVRGEAFHGLFAYASWCNQNLKESAGKNVLVEEVKKILEEYLDITVEPSLTVRAVYGRYFPLLHALDKEWAMKNVDKIFPQKDLPRFYSAWETYLTNPLYDGITQDLAPQFFFAVNNPIAKSKRRPWQDPDESFAAHVVMGFLFQLENPKLPASKEFFAKASPEQKGMAISFVGRHYIHSDKSGKEKIYPEADRLKKFWIWRLKESSDQKELAQFGWWIRPGEFEDKWAVEMLLRTLEKTKGVIDATFKVMEALVVWAKVYPTETSRALHLMIQGRNKETFFHIEEKEIAEVFSIITQVGDQRAKKNVELARDYLLKLGFEKFRVNP